MNINFLHESPYERWFRIEWNTQLMPERALTSFKLPYVMHIGRRSS